VGGFLAPQGTVNTNLSNFNKQEREAMNQSIEKLNPEQVHKISGLT